MERCAAHGERTSGSGGALAQHRGVLSVLSSNFSACWAQEDGGVALIKDGLAHIQGSALAGSNANVEGGALRVVGDANVTVEDCTLTSNHVRARPA
jgi:hypothetical protein